MLTPIGRVSYPVRVPVTGTMAQSPTHFRIRKAQWRRLAAAGQFDLCREQRAPILPTIGRDVSLSRVEQDQSLVGAVEEALWAATIAQGGHNRSPVFARVLGFEQHHRIGIGRFRTAP